MGHEFRDSIVTNRMHGKFRFTELHLFVAKKQVTQCYHRDKRRASLQIDVMFIIKELDPREIYKYLRINEGYCIQEVPMMEIIRKVFY